MTDRVRFPARRPDGTFSFVARFACSSTEPGLAEAVQIWMDHWVEEHASSTSIVTDASGSRGVVHEFFDDFVSTPNVIVSAPDVILVQFDCLADADYWKNWFVMMTRALIEQFDSIDNLLGCENVKE